jgi:hypothetical protein
MSFALDVVTGWRVIQKYVLHPVAQWLGLRSR